MEKDLVEFGNFMMKHRRNRNEAIEFLKKDAVKEAGFYGFRSVAAGMLEELEKTKQRIADGDLDIFT